MLRLKAMKLLTLQYEKHSFIYVCIQPILEYVKQCTRY